MFRYYCRIEPIQTYFAARIFFARLFHGVGERAPRTVKRLDLGEFGKQVQ